MSEPTDNLASRTRATFILFTIVSAAGILFADTYTPLGFAHGTIYFGPLLLISMLRNASLLIIALVLLAALTIAGYFLSPNGIDREIAIANRAVSVAAMAAFVIAVVGHWRDRGR